MQKYSFFNSVNGDRKYKAEDFAEYYSSFLSNGIFPLPASGLQVQINELMSVKVLPGKAWINGYYFCNTAEEILNIDTADGVLKRIDRIVVCLDFLKRNITLNVKKGSLSSIPTAPALQRDADKYELALADIFISNGITSITSNMITDQRNTEKLCGTVTQTVETIDIHNLTKHLTDASNPHNVNLKQVGGSNTNLLDNWDFRNPVNQRGQTQYSGYINGGRYCIDRWLMHDYNADTSYGVFVADRGVKVMRGKANSCRMTQKINPELIKSLTGKKITFSVKIAESTASLTMYIVVNDENIHLGTVPTGTVGMFSYSYTLPQTITSLAVFFQVAGTEGQYAIVESAKLEIGEVSTLENDAPADYQSEYRKCLSYYFQGELFSPEIYVAGYTTAKYRVYNLQFPTKMRCTPTISLPNGQFATKDGYKEIVVNQYGVENFYAISLDGVIGGISDTTMPGCITIEASADL